MTKQFRSRRHILRFGASAALVGLTRKSGLLAATGDDRLVAPGADACIVTPLSIEGPYYDNGTMIRSNVRDAVEGLPLRLAIKVVDTTSDACPALEGARVDIWQADAYGAYSNVPLERQGRQGRETGIDTTGQMFLRGSQLTDEHGIAEFETIVPGWYYQIIRDGGFPRVTHIHVKVFLDDRVATIQAYLPDSFNERIYRDVVPYRDTPYRWDSGGRQYERIANEEDVAYQSGDPVLALAEEGEGFAGSTIIGWGGGQDPSEVRIIGRGPSGMGRGGMGPPGEFRGMRGSGDRVRDSAVESPDE